MPSRGVQSSVIVLAFVGGRGARRLPHAPCWRGALRGGERLFALHPPTVAGQVAVAADGAMAGDDERDRIQGAGAADRACRLGSAQEGCDLAVAALLAVGYGAKRLPHAPLEGGRTHVERQLEPGLLAGEVVEEGMKRAAEGLVVAADRGGGKVVVQLVHEVRLLGAEADHADAALGGRNEQPAERAGGDGVADRRAGTAAAVGGGGHAELAVRPLIEPAR